jgi:hypothetical protein
MTCGPSHIPKRDLTQRHPSFQAGHDVNCLLASSPTLRGITGMAMGYRLLWAAALIHEHDEVSRAGFFHPLESLRHCLTAGLDVAQYHHDHRLGLDLLLRVSSPAS